MANESGDVTDAVELRPADDAVIAIDPVDLPADLNVVELAPIAIAEVLPADGASDVPADAQTFGGPVEDSTVSADDSGIAYTTVLYKDAPVDGASDVPADAQTFGGSVDGSAVDGSVPVDDSGMVYTTTVVADTPADGASDVPADAQTFGGSVDASAEDSTVPVDDSGIFYTMGAIDLVPVEDTSADGGSDAPVDATDGVEVIGRPIDPQPNWRTLDGAGDSSDGSSTDGASTDYSGTDVIPVFDKDPGDITTDGSDSLPEVIYTLDPSDPLIYASSAGDLPGRPSDPLPFERTNSIPVVAPEPEIDRTPVHYAASEPFHTGLDLL